MLKFLFRHFLRTVIHDQRGIDPITIGGLALAAGGGFFFGKKKKKRPDVPKFTGTRPFTSLKEIPEQQEFLKSLRERISGVGVGFREKELSAATSPFAAARRAGLREETIPLISAQASARGVGRSTIPVSRIGLESSRAERDIGERIAQIRLANEQQRRAEINAALGQFGQFPQQEAAQQARRAGFELGEFQTQRGLGVQTEQFREQQKQQDFQNLISLGQLGVSGVSALKPSKGLFEGATISLPEGEEQSFQTLLDAEIARRENAAKVKKSK